MAFIIFQIFIEYNTFCNINFLSNYKLLYKFYQMSIWSKYFLYLYFFQGFDEFKTY